MIKHRHRIIIHAIAIRLHRLDLGRGVERRPRGAADAVRILTARREQRECVPAAPPRLRPERELVLDEVVVARVVVEDVRHAEVGNDQVAVVVE